MWSNSKLNSFTKSFTSSSSSSTKSTVTGGETLKKTDKTSIAKKISNNFSSLSNYSLSLAVGSNSNSKNAEKSPLKDQNQSSDLKEENLSNKRFPLYIDV